MEFWFSESQTPHVKLSIRVDRQLYSGKSEFHKIRVGAFGAKLRQARIFFNFHAPSLILC